MRPWLNTMVNDLPLCPYTHLSIASMRPPRLTAANPIGPWAMRDPAVRFNENMALRRVPTATILITEEVEVPRLR
jgi:hypothetical protein